MGDLWNAILYQPLLTALIWLYNILFHNFGLAVIAITIVIRAVLVPITIPALKSAKKMMELKPHLDVLKEKHGNDKQRLQQEQLRLYKEHGFNPLAGCLPYLIQFLVLIALYQVFINFLNNGQVNGMVINKSFLGIDLSKPDRTFILPLLAGATQLILSLMMMPSTSSKNVLLKEPEEKATTEKKAKEGDMQESMQKQMLFLMPVMTVFFGFSLPSGLALYWVVTTVFSVVQQYFVTGLGGLRPLLIRLKIVS